MKNMRWQDEEGEVDEGWMDICEGVIVLVFGEVILGDSGGDLGGLRCWDLLP